MCLVLAINLFDSHYDGYDERNLRALGGPN